MNASTRALSGQPLSRAAIAARGQVRPAPPARIVHLGLGGFHRAHQAWYTAHAGDGVEWGIAAFSGRSPQLPAQLTAQDGLYTLIERGPTADRYEVVDSIVQAGCAAAVDEFAGALADPIVSILTLTITEDAYRLNGAGRIDLRDEQVSSDIVALRALSSGDRERAAGQSGRSSPPQTALGRVLYGLDRRRIEGAPPIAIVPCDNLPANGEKVGQALVDLAAEVNDELVRWLPDSICAVSTSVDRITPRTAPEETANVLAATSMLDVAPVVTEPFSDWVLAGDFPSGRPHWESAGARFVQEIEPWEQRKLTLLNGAHTLMAALGPLRGHRTVADAIADPVCRAAVEELWHEAAEQLPGIETSEYRAALLERFANPRIEHLLAQIAEDALVKLRLRIVPVARARLIAGREVRGCARAVAAWLVAKRATSHQNGIVTLAEVDAGLAADARFVTLVADAIEEIEKSV